MPTPEPIKEALKRALDQNKTRYAPSSGIPELRSAIAEKLRTKNRIQAQESDVIVVNGGMQGLFGAFQSTINPGDEVLLFSQRWLVTQQQKQRQSITTLRRIHPALSLLLKKHAVSRVLPLNETWW
jgi:aspartate/methionine/tyrosine aminotransferase